MRFLPSRSSNILALALALSAPSAPGQTRVDELFGEGAFGVIWGMTPERVTEVHPDGEWLGAEMSNYRVRDDRTIFELERTRRDEISFSFVADSLVGISITFPECSALVTKLGQVIGVMDAMQPDRAPNPVPMGIWSGTDLSLSVSLLLGFDQAQPGQCLLIAARSLEPIERSREELGLE